MIRLCTLAFSMDFFSRFMQLNEMENPKKKENVIDVATEEEEEKEKKKKLH